MSDRWTDEIKDEVFDKILQKVGIMDFLNLSMVSTKWRNIWDKIQLPDLNVKDSSPLSSYVVFRSEDFIQFRERSQLIADNGGTETILFVSKTADPQDKLRDYLLHSILYQPKNMIIHVPWFNNVRFPFGFFPCGLTFKNTVLPNQLDFLDLTSLTLVDCSCVFGFKKGDFVIIAPKLQVLIIEDKAESHLCWHYACFELQAPKIEILEITSALFNSYSFKDPLQFLKEAKIQLGCLRKESSLWNSAKPRNSTAILELLNGVSLTESLVFSLEGLEICEKLLESTKALLFTRLAEIEFQSVEGKSEQHLMLINRILERCPNVKDIFATPKNAEEATSVGQWLRSIAPEGAEVHINKGMKEGKC